jgi:hypothetical protein
MQIPQKTWRIQQEFDDFPRFAHEKHEKPAIKPLVNNWTFRQIRLSPCFFFAWLGKSLRASKPRCLNRPSHGALGFQSPFPSGCPGFLWKALYDTKKHHTPT